MKLGKKVFLLLIVFNLSLSTIVLSASQNIATTKISSTSIIIGETLPGALSHYQVTKTGVEMVWRSPYIEDDFDDAVIADLDNDNKLEIVALVTNRMIQLLDFETGLVIWEVVIPSIAANYGEILVGDILGDDNKEIIYKSNSFWVADQLDYAVVIFDHLGNELQVIKSQPGIQTGPDNIEIVDFDDDGKEELILSYGETLWNRTKFQDGDKFAGSYVLQHWVMGDNPNKMVLEFDIQGSDNGGNTELLVIKKGRDSIIITSGWYNNPVRAFNAKGELLWERSLYEKNEFVQLSSNLLSVLTQSDGEHLYIFQNNYWFNYTLSWFDVDPLTGIDNREKIEFDNSRELYGNVINNQIIIAVSLNESNQEQSKIISRYYLYDPELFDELQEYTDNGNAWSATYTHKQYTQPIDLGMGSPFILVKDDMGNMKLGGLNTQFVFSQIAFSSNRFTLNKNYDKLSGTTIIRYTNVLGWAIMIILFTNILLLAAILIRKTSLDKKFQQKFANFQWKMNSYYRVRRILASLKILEIEGESPEESNFDDFYKSNEMGSLTPMKTKEEFQNFVSGWLLKHEKDVRKIKAGDIAILIEYLDLLPDYVTVTQIIDRLSDYPKSSIYRRTDFLLKIGLIESTTFGGQDDLRGKELQISPNGIEFLRSVFSSLSFYFTN